MDWDCLSGSVRLSPLQGCVFLVNSVVVCLSVNCRRKQRVGYFYTYMIHGNFVLGEGVEFERGLVLRHLESRESLFYSITHFKTMMAAFVLEFGVKG